MQVQFASAAQVTRTGGVPLAPAGTLWPCCTSRNGPMQFLAQVVLDDPGDGSGGHAQTLAHPLTVDLPGAGTQFTATAQENPDSAQRSKSVEARCVGCNCRLRLVLRVVVGLVFVGRVGPDRGGEELRSPNTCAS